MSKLVVGIDPDSDRHGVAFYRDGELTGLGMMRRVEILEDIRFLPGLIVSIEDVCANNFIYTRNNKGSREVHGKVALSVGRCQQAQTELMRDLEHYGISFVLHKPQKGNWAKNKAQFEKVTGWKARSNEDTRSAAYFGYLAL